MRRAQACSAGAVETDGSVTAGSSHMCVCVCAGSSHIIEQQCVLLLALFL